MRTHQNRRFLRLVTYALIGLCVALGEGCSRQWFRQSADADAYHLIDSREIDPQWETPDRAVEPDVRSRMADPYCPDCEPRPPDDTAAAKWMNDLHYRPLKYYEKIECAPAIESEMWLDYLPRTTDGKVDISRETAVALGLLHSREYQSQVEQVYLGALGLAGNRFEFVVQWLGGSGLDYTANGSDLGPPSGSWSNSLGASRNLAAGGQLAANLLNSFTWAGGGGGTSTASSLVLSLTQPLLRGAFQHVRLEGLTQAERGLLYQVRDFAHFRREFYLGITQSYLRLLTQIQSVRNQQANLENLELNLREHQELFARQMVSQIQVDQVLQQYQSGRIDLFSSEQGLESAYDSLKFQLGLPPDIDLKLDESLLKSFELTAPELEKLQMDVQANYQELVQYLPPQIAPIEKLNEITKKFQEYSAAMEAMLPSVEKELERWQAKLKAGAPASASAETKLDWEQQSGLAKQIVAVMSELKKELAEYAKARDRWPEELQQLPEADRWDWLSKDKGQRLREQVGTLFVIQTQVRLFLLDIPRFDLQQAAAVEMAYSLRLDLMNQQAAVTDAFRGVEVAADALQSGLDIEAGATLATEPGNDNPIAFDSSSAQYRVGLQFDGPLNRFAERNAYRASQIAYQQSRRDYMAAKDALANGIRSNIRALRVNELNFQVTRQQLITATRQVEEAQINLRTTREPNSNLTRDLLQALQGLLGAENNLISSWIEYEVGRIQLFVDLEILQLDENGAWINEKENPGEANGDSIPDTSNEPVGPNGPPGPVTEQPSTTFEYDDLFAPVGQRTYESHPLLGFNQPDELPPIVKEPRR